MSKLQEIAFKYIPKKINTSSGYVVDVNEATRFQALRIAVEILSVCAQIADNPYGDEVQAMGGEEPLAVGKKIADAIRRLATTK